jgi:hypothetical protein
MTSEAFIFEAVSFLLQSSKVIGITSSRDDIFLEEVRPLILEQIGKQSVAESQEERLAIILFIPFVWVQAACV